MAALAAAGHEAVALNHDGIDITDSASVDRAIGEQSPALIVNTAA